MRQYGNMALMCGYGEGATRVLISEFFNKNKRNLDVISKKYHNVFLGIHFEKLNMSQRVFGVKWPQIPTHTLGNFPKIY
jgi:hypothetical protein